MPRKNGKKTHKAKAEKPPESGVSPPSHLSPIAHCHENVLERSRIEFYLALIISIIASVLPMSGLTRSLLLLFVLVPLVDIAWRSRWFHLWNRASKIIATVLLVVIYLVVAASLIIREHEAAALAVKTYLNSERAEWLFRWLYFLAGFVVAYLSLKLFSLLSGYLKSRRAQKLAIRQRFRETKKGWLDYRLESEESSKHLHYLVGRIERLIIGLGRFMRYAPWFIGKEGKTPNVTRAQVADHLITIVCEKYSDMMEPELADLEATANVFIESTEGYVKALEIATKQDYVILAGLHDYFEAQLKDVHTLANSMIRLPRAFARVRGTSQDSTAAINRQVSLWQAQIAIMRRVEGHCARMVKLTETYFERAILGAAWELVATLRKSVNLIARLEKKNPGFRAALKK